MWQRHTSSGNSHCQSPRMDIYMYDVYNSKLSVSPPRVNLLLNHPNECIAGTDGQYEECIRWNTHESVLRSRQGVRPVSTRRLNRGLSGWRVKPREDMHAPTHVTRRAPVSWRLRRALTDHAESVGSSTVHYGMHAYAAFLLILHCQPRRLVTYIRGISVSKLTLSPRQQVCATHGV